MSKISINIEDLSEGQALTQRNLLVEALDKCNEQIFPGSSWQEMTGYPTVPEEVECYSQKELLDMLIEALNDLDGDDCFGTEGWRHYFGFE